MENWWFLHDDNLVRACDSSLKVDSSTLKELQSYKLFGTDETMPLFKDVLSLVDSKVPLLIELKTDNNVMSKRYMKLCQKLKECLSGYEGTYAIQSFDPRVLWWFSEKTVRRFQEDSSWSISGDMEPMWCQSMIFFASHLLFDFITSRFYSYQYMESETCLAFPHHQGTLWRTGIFLDSP